MSVALYHYSYGNVKGTRIMMKVAHEYLKNYQPKYWGLDLELVLDYIDSCLSIIPEVIDKVPFSKVEALPKLPQLFLYLQDG